MSAGRKLFCVISIAGLILLLSLAIFSACDNRKAVNPKLNADQKVTMNVSPTNLVIHSLTRPDTAEIDIRVRDAEGSGLDSLEVEIFRSPEVGTIVPPGLTQDGGYCTALFVTDQGAVEDSIITLIASSGNGADTATLTITVALATISMSLLPPNLVVHSLNKSDSVDIDIRVRDGNGNGIDSVEVNLTRTPATGTIVPPGYTTLGGHASAMYVTDPGIDQDMQIILTANAGSAIDVDTLNILVSLQGEIDTMNISLGKTTLIADGADNTSIYVSVFDTTGIPIGDGTVISMEHYGAGIGGTIDSTFKKTQNGIVTFVLTAPPKIDTTMIIDQETLHAWGISESGDTSHAYATITYVPDDPAVVEIITIPVEMVAGSGESQEIVARVSDDHGSFVRNGTQIRFVNQFPTSDITTLTTTESGYATAVYTVGTESGIDVIKAMYTKPGTVDTVQSGEVPINIRSSVPTNIALTTSDATIEVGGIATQVYATMQDENGNPLSDGFEIRFQITAAPSMTGPAGPSFNFVSGPDSILLETVEETNVNGRASVALFSGTMAGTVRIKATSLDDENIFKEKPLITIQSGPPAVIQIGPSNIAEAWNESIITGITAQVWDEFTNPVEPLTAVHFEVLPDTIAFIEGAAYTGGWVNEDGDTVGVRGMASTWMAYTCYHTFDTVRVIASSGDMADTSENIILALYNGTLSVDADPGVLYVDIGQLGYSEISALLQDGLYCPIKYGIILFSTSGCGNIYGQTVDTTDVTGYAYTTFSIHYDQIPPREPPLPPACDAKVKARLRGYPDVSGDTDIFCTVAN